MVVLNFYGKIEPICISEKLKLFISNLPEEEMNEWQTELAEEFEFREAVSNISNKRLGLEPEDRVIQLYTKVFPNVPKPECVDSKVLKQLAENMICIYFDYQYSDMPLGGWETNCFDGRFCEEDYAEKVVDYNGPRELDHGIEKMREHGIMRLTKGRSANHVIQNVHVGI